MNIGIIGLGFMGQTHLVGWSKLKEAHVVAVAARGDKLTIGKVTGNLGQELPLPDMSAITFHQDWKPLLADPSIDAVDICLPTDLHEPVATAALSAGKHVLCEKPMALDGAQCDRLLATAQQANRILMIGHVLRFWPAYQYLRDFVLSGKYGSVRSATFTRLAGLPDWSKWLPDEARSGGAILDLLVHDLDQILLLFGPPSAVRAKALGTVDGVSATLLYPDGPHVRGPEIRLQGGWMPSGTPFSMAFQLQTDRARLELTSDGLFLNDSTGQQNKIELAETFPWMTQLAYFQQCCETGQNPDLCPPQQSAAAVKLAAFVKQSRSMEGELVACVI